MVRESASIASVPKGLIFSCVGAQNQILDCETFVECPLGIILMVKSKATRLWCDHSLSPKPIVFLRRQGCGSAPVRKNLDQLSCGSSLKDFYFGVS